MSTNFISSNGSDETRNMHTKTNNIEIMMGRETDKIIDKLFKSLLQNYQKDLEESMRGSNFVFNSVDLLSKKSENKSKRNRIIIYRFSRMAEK